MKEIGLKIRQYRKRKGLTQEELAAKSDLSVMSIRRYESGERMATEDVLERIATALGTTVNWLLPPDNYWEDENGVGHTVPMYQLAPEPTEDELDKRLQEVYQSLNLKGRQKAVERVEELTEIPKYQKEKSPADGD